MTKFASQKSYVHAIPKNVMYGKPEDIFDNRKNFRSSSDIVNFRNY